jgi:hypothetical protein
MERRKEKQLGREGLLPEGRSGKVSSVEPGKTPSGDSMLGRNGKAFIP